LGGNTASVSAKAPSVSGIVLDFLLQAAGVQSQKLIPKNNLYREIGFEDGCARLGWVVPPVWRDVERAIRLFNDLDIARGKTRFIFSGMGGSVNTIKALIDILGKKSRLRLFTIDSLDPSALKQLLPQVGDLRQTLVVGISKSGTTKETRDLLATLRERFQNEGLDYREHFLWLTDLPLGRQKVEEGSWRGVRFLPIQTDNGTDIGGRFTAPHTLIFLIPLFLLLGRDAGQLKTLWEEYLGLRHMLLPEAARRAEELATRGSDYYAVVLTEELASAMETWIIQLFQESLGSKALGFNPKTLAVAHGAVPKDFVSVDFNISSGSPILDAMVNMHLLQVFVAVLAYFRAVNFVTQPEVELYKRKMAEISSTVISRAEKTTLDGLRSIKLPNRLVGQKRFVEAVCYWNLTGVQRMNLQEALAAAFPDREVMVFAGSDWNHHSYQAASKSQDTLYLILAKHEYALNVEGISRKTLEQNVTTLRTIAYATYETLKDRAAHFEVDAPEERVHY